MVDYKLTYFDARGLMEPSRWILAYSGANWTEERFQNAIPEELKPKLRFQQVPLLEFGNDRLVQSRAIARFLARKFNLAGRTELESAQCDEIVDACVDVNGLFYPFAREEDAAKKADGIAKTAIVAKERFFAEFGRTLKANGKYLVGDSVTWADFFVAHFVDNIQRIYSVDIVGDFPELKQHLELITGLPGIQEWIVKRPVTLF